MSHTQQQLERVARCLDGEAVELTAAERALAAEITAGESMLSVLEAPLPRAAADRARRRMAAAAAAPSLRKRVLRYVVSVEAAAVAGLLIVAGTLSILAPDLPDALTAVPTSVLVQSTQSSVNGDLDAVTSALDDLEADIVVSTPAPRDDDLGIESMQQDMQEFFQTVPAGTF